MNLGYDTFKKPLVASFCLCGLLSSFAALATSSQSYTVELQADVPSDSFQVIPVESGWINQTQYMEYDIPTKKLHAFEKQFQYKNTAGGIQATLTNTDASGEAVLSNGKETIPLAITFNGVKLSQKTATVVASAAAKAGGRTALKITQANDKALTNEGSFTGQVAMVFEPLIDNSSSS